MSLGGGPFFDFSATKALSTKSNYGSTAVFVPSSQYFQINFFFRIGHVEVSEEGTKAAAATVIGMVGFAMPLLGTLLKLLTKL